MARNPDWQDSENRFSNDDRSKRNDRYSNSDRYSDNDRYFTSDRYSPDDQRMRGGGDRTITGDGYGMGQRNSYRSDDYATDNNRGGFSSGERDRSRQFGNRNNQTHSERGYNWSSDYGATQDYRTTSDRDRGFSGGRGGGSASGFSSGLSSGSSFQSPTDGDYGQGYFGSGQASSNYGSSIYGSHTGKGPKGYRRSDDRIREDVSDSLERHPGIDASEIEVDVKDGIVTLRGHVEERRVKRMAEDAIENLQGVKDVRNELQVDQTLFQQAKSLLFGQTAEAEAANSGAPNRSTGGKSKH